MTKWDKFWMKPLVYMTGLMTGPAFFSTGMKICGAFVDPIGIVVGLVICFIGLAMIWFPFNAFKDNYNKLRDGRDTILYSNDDINN